MKSFAVFAGVTAAFLMVQIGSAQSVPVREPWTTSRIKGAPDPPKPYVPETVFTNLKIENGVEIVPHKGRLFVMERSGKIWLFPENETKPKPKLFCDLKLKEVNGQAFGMAFHPKKQEVFLTFVADRNVEEGNQLSRFRYSRFESGAPILDSDSEEIILKWRDGGHHGGNIQFGPDDGLLYLSTGDAAPPNPPDSLNTGQDNSDLLCCILRIDIDDPRGGNQYEIPPDNPFVGVAAPGGRTIQNHYEAALLGETNPEDPKAMLYEYNKQKMTLKEMLTAEKWDYVTIQQSSPNSFKIDTYRPYAQNLYDYIKKYAPQAEVVFHQTWAWRPDHNRMNMDKNPPGFMYHELTRNYHTIANEVGIRRIIPVGNAFQLAEETPEWKFARDPDFDYNNPKYPELPKEPNSLNGGFAWRGTDGADKVFVLDGSHASGAGSYLAACVWYEFFFGEDVRKITRNPGFLGERAASLREFAHQAVNGTRPKAWPSNTSPE